MREWLGISDMSNVSHTLAKWELLFQCFDSIQLPSSGNNDKQSGCALIRMVVIHQAHGLVQHASCLLPSTTQVPDSRVCILSGCRPALKGRWQTKECDRFRNSCG